METRLFQGICHFLGLVLALEDVGQQEPAEGLQVRRSGQSQSFFRQGLNVVQGPAFVEEAAGEKQIAFRLVRAIRTTSRI